MGKNRNKHRNLIPNPYRLRIDEIKYNINESKTIECIIRYINPITLSTQIAKGKANCRPEDGFSVEVGKHIAEGRAKYNMYLKYLTYIEDYFGGIQIKYDKLLSKEKEHLQEIINDL